MGLTPVLQCLNSVLNVKAVVAAFNREKALVGAFSVITNLRMELFEALAGTQMSGPRQLTHVACGPGPHTGHYTTSAFG